MEELKRVYYLQSVLQLNTKDDCDDNTSTTMKLINQHYSSEDNHDKPVVCLESPSKRIENVNNRSTIRRAHFNVLSEL